MSRALLVALAVVALLLASGCIDEAVREGLAPRETVVGTVVGQEGRQAARVTRVVDGDTFHVTVDGKKDTVRLIGIDTPETVAPGRPIDCYGPEASAHLKRLIDSTTVYLEKDVSERDRFGRLLRYVYQPDGRMVNARLVDEGYARAVTFPPDVAQAEHFRLLERAARDANRGLWAAC